MLPKRKPLGHETPSWVEAGSVYFVTICTQRRGDIITRIAQQLVESAQHLHLAGKWYARIFLVMPDHAHALLSVPPQSRLSALISSWKGYTAKTFGVEWQQRFLDHRLRSDESLDEKLHYIMMNPVRAKLATKPQDWPYVFYGSAGTPRPTTVTTSHA